MTDYIYSYAGNNVGTSVNTDGQTALHLASSALQVDTVKVLCIEFPYTINRGDKEGRTALILAAGAQIPITTRTTPGRKGTLQSNEDVGAIETLLQHGADVRARDFRGNTCLHQACAWGNLKSARMLVQAGADPLAANHAGWKPDAYSLSVQADVYFRNLVAEFEKRKAEENARKREEHRPTGGGQVRLVQEQETLEDEPESYYDADDSSRSRASSGNSNSTGQSTRYDTAPMGLNIRNGGRFLSSDSWK